MALQNAKRHNFKKITKPFQKWPKNKKIEMVTNMTCLFKNMMHKENRKREP